MYILIRTQNNDNNVVAFHEYDRRAAHCTRHIIHNVLIIIIAPFESHTAHVEQNRTATHKTPFKETIYIGDTEQNPLQKQ